MSGLSNLNKGLVGYDPDLSGFVPYTGATQNVDLGSFSLTSSDLTDNGNLTFGGTARRVSADMSNATRANRLAFQTSTTNGNTRLGFLPNGTSTVSGIDCYAGTDPDNANFLQVHADGSGPHVGLNSSKTGTGTTRDLVFQIDGVTQGKFNASDGKLNLTTLTASQAVVTDANKNLISLNYTSAATASTLVSRDSNGNSNFNNANEGSLTITGTGGTTTLTAASPKSIIVNLSSGTQTILLPVVTTLTNGAGYDFFMQGAGSLIIQSSGGNQICRIIGVQGFAVLRVLDTTAGTGIASWTYYYASQNSGDSLSLVQKGSTGGISLAFYSSNASSPASLGLFRLSAGDAVSWRNQANTNNLSITKDTNDIFTINAPLSSVNAFSQYTTTATAASTTTLTVTSTGIQDFTGATTQTVKMPVVTTLQNGASYQINNYSSGNVTVQSSGGNTIATLTVNQSLTLWVKSTAGGTGTASWGWLSPQTLAG